MRMKNVFLLSVALALTACGPVTATTPTPATTPSAPAASRSELAQLPHERIDYHIARFTGEKRAEFASYLERKQQYESMITEKLRRRGMPEDLLYLAMIESGFNPQARSLAGARDLATARRYGAALRPARR